MDNSKASSLLKRSDHLLSNSASLESVESIFLALESALESDSDFLDLDGGFSFLLYFSGGIEEDAGDLSADGWPTTPIIETLAGSTSSDGS